MQYSIIDFIGVKHDASGFRLDAEHYRQEYLLVKNKLMTIGAISLKECIKQPVITGHTPSMKNERYYDGEVNFVKTDNLRENEITTEFTDKLSAEGNNKIRRSTLRENDVLITIIGATNEIVGRTALVHKEVLPANINQNIALIRTTDRVLPSFLVVYLNSYYGRNCLWYLSRQTEQVNLNCREVEQLLIPNVSKSFQIFIDKIHIESCELREKSKVIYRQAKQMLLSELGLLDLKPKRQLAFVKNFSDTKNADRIDAEYFQPMYEEVELILSKRNRRTLESICSLINYGTIPTSPYSEVGIPYIKGLNLIEGFIQGNLDFLVNTENLPKKFYTKEHDIIISQMGTVGKAGLVVKGQENWLFASFTIRARLYNNEFIDPYVLTLYINEIARKWYLMRNIAQASVRQNTDLPTIKNLLVPEIPQNTQHKISSIIKKSYELKKESKNLLNIAKRGVEIAIEKNETEAEKWINQEVNNYAK